MEQGKNDFNPHTFPSFISWKIEVGPGTACGIQGQAVVSSPFVLNETSASS